MRYLFIAIALIAMVGVPGLGGAANAASVVNPVTPECRAKLYAAQQARQGDFVLKYEICLKEAWNANLEAAEFMIDDVERLLSDVRDKASFLARRRTCLPGAYLTQFREETLQRAERARRQLASFDTVREMITADYQVDITKAWANGLLPENLDYWTRKTIYFKRNFGYGDRYDAVRLAAQDAARLKDEIRATIVQRNDCEPTAASSTGKSDDALAGAIGAAGGRIETAASQPNSIAFSIVGKWKMKNGVIVSFKKGGERGHEYTGNYEDPTHVLKPYHFKPGDPGFLVNEIADETTYRGEVRWCFIDANIPCEWRGPYTLTVTGPNTMSDGGGMLWDRVVPTKPKS